MLECQRLVSTVLLATALLWHCDAGAGLPTSLHEQFPAESLGARPASRISTVAQSTAGNEDMATQGPFPSPAPVRQPGPRRDLSPAAAQTSRPQSSETASPALPRAPHLPFEIGQEAQGQPGVTPPEFPPPARPQDTGARKPSPRQKTPKLPPGRQKKSNAVKTATTSQDQRQPKPYVPPGQAAPLPSAQAIPRMNPGQTPYPSVPPATQLMATTPPAAPGTVAGSGAQALPSLPPALPYTSTESRPQAAQRVPLPAQDGTVLARVPVPGGPGEPSPAVEPTGRQVPQNLQAAQPLGWGNPLDGFILDSFGSRRPLSQPQAVPVTVQPSAEASPSGSMLEQLGRDFRNLGQGVKDTFSRILPGP